jgi:hypothetical protein
MVSIYIVLCFCFVFAGHCNIMAKTSCFDEMTIISTLYHRLALITSSRLKPVHIHVDILSHGHVVMNTSLPIFDLMVACLE